MKKTTIVALLLATLYVSIWAIWPGGPIYRLANYIRLGSHPPWTIVTDGNEWGFVDQYGDIQPYRTKNEAITACKKERKWHESYIRERDWVGWQKEKEVRP